MNVKILYNLIKYILSSTALEVNIADLPNEKNTNLPNNYYFTFFILTYRYHKIILMVRGCKSSKIGLFFKL